MEKVAHYRTLVADLLAQEAQYLPRNGEVELLTVCDTTHDHYQLLCVGWESQQRVFAPRIHARIHQGKIWIAQDGTEAGTAHALVRAGVPRTDIVLAFHAPWKRPYTDFAVAYPRRAIGVAAGTVVARSRWAQEATAQVGALHRVGVSTRSCRARSAARNAARLLGGRPAGAYGAGTLLVAPSPRGQDRSLERSWHGCLTAAGHSRRPHPPINADPPQDAPAPVPWPLRHRVGIWRVPQHRRPRDERSILLSSAPAPRTCPQGHAATIRHTPQPVQVAKRIPPRVFLLFLGSMKPSSGKPAESKTLNEVDFRAGVLLPILKKDEVLKSSRIA